MTSWTGHPCNCLLSPSDDALDSWAEQSVDSPGAKWIFPQTAVMNVFCTPPETNNAAAQGQYFATHMEARNVANYSMYLIAGCTNFEGTWDGTHMPSGKSGYDMVDQWSIENCIPRYTM